MDKAGNNCDIVCKKFYLDAIKNELGISHDRMIIGNKVYKPIYQKANDMCKCQAQRLLGELVTLTDV